MDYLNQLICLTCQFRLLLSILPLLVPCRALPFTVVNLPHLNWPSSQKVVPFSIKYLLFHCLEVEELVVQC